MDASNCLVEGIVRIEPHLRQMFLRNDAENNRILDFLDSFVHLYSKKVLGVKNNFKFLKFTAQYNIYFLKAFLNVELMQIMSYSPEKGPKRHI